MQERALTWEDINGRTDDLQSASIFPVTASVEDLGILIRWMISEPQLEEGKQLWLKAEKVSADEISARANLKRLYEQRSAYRRSNKKTTRQSDFCATDYWELCPAGRTSPVSMYIQTRLYGDVAPSASTWQEGGQIPLPTLSIREEVLSTWLSN